MTKREKTLLWSVWRAMKNRCYNKQNSRYDSYGGRGILICKKWYHSLDCFLIWAMKNGYEEGLTLDRINNDLSYRPSNCRWVTRKINSNNRRDTRKIKYKNKIYTLQQLCEIAPNKIGHNSLFYRLKRGWNVEKAITKPIWNRYGN